MLEVLYASVTVVTKATGTIAQILTNVEPKARTNVTSMLFVQTLKDRMCVDASEDTKEMGDNVQLSLWFALHLAV